MYKRGWEGERWHPPTRSQKTQPRGLKSMTLHLQRPSVPCAAAAVLCKEPVFWVVMLSLMLAGGRGAKHAKFLVETLHSHLQKCICHLLGCCPEVVTLMEGSLSSRATTQIQLSACPGPGSGAGTNAPFAILLPPFSSLPGPGLHWLEKGRPSQEAERTVISDLGASVTPAPGNGRGF